MRYEPYARPHDQAQPGLRDYRPRVGADPAGVRWLLLVTLIVLVFVLGFASGQAYAAGCVSLKVTPAVLVQRSDVRIETRIPRHADHRRLAVSWGSINGKDGGFQVDLEGEASPIYRTDIIRELPPAEYQFIAAVYGPSGKMLARDSAEIHTLTATVTSAEHEQVEGYFELGDTVTLIAKPGSSTWHWLRGVVGRRAKLTLEEPAARQLEVIR